MAVREIQTDVVVIGSGMAGLVTGVKATEYPVEVTVLEKGHRPGGSMYISHGSLNTYGTIEEIAEDIPDGKRELQQLLVDTYDEGLEWLEELGIELKDRMKQSRSSGTAKLMEPVEFTEQMVEIITDRDGELLLDTPMERLRTDDHGDVTGVVANSDNGRIIVKAGSVVIATGGFQGNEYLVQQFITDAPQNLWLRSNPWSTGDGLMAAMELNAKTTMGMETFYGHNLIAPPAEFSPLEFVEASQYYGPHAVALDVSGERYTDESETPSEVTLAQDTARLANGQAYLIVDKDIYDGKTVTERHIGSMIEQAREMGGPVVQADDLEGLRDALADWEINETRALETIRSYNETLRGGRASELHPPRRTNHNVIDTPPFYAIEVRPGITFTMGGLDVTTNGEVLRRSATSSSLNQKVNDIKDVKTEPIPGLYAAGSDLGNIHHRKYLGGLAVALVTGIAAGDSAATSAFEASSN